MFSRYCASIWLCFQKANVSVKVQCWGLKSVVVTKKGEINKLRVAIPIRMVWVVSQSENGACQFCWTESCFWPSYWSARITLILWQRFKEETYCYWLEVWIIHPDGEFSRNVVPSSVMGWKAFSFLKVWILNFETFMFNMTGSSN